MTTERIEKLAEVVFEAEQRYQIMGIRNTSHLDYNEQKKARVEYVLAETAMIKARQELRAEQGL